MKRELLLMSAVMMAVAGCANTPSQTASDASYQHEDVVTSHSAMTGPRGPTGPVGEMGEQGRPEYGEAQRR